MTSSDATAGTETPGGSPDVPSGASGRALSRPPNVKLLDLTGRERQLRAAMAAMQRAAAAFARGARRTLPFLARQRSRILTGAVAIFDSTVQPSGPAVLVDLRADDGAAWGALLLEAGALSIVLEGALGGRETSVATDLGTELTPAQRALSGRVARSLGADLAAALASEVGMKMSVSEVVHLAAGQSPPAEESEGLRVECTFEGVEGEARILLSLCADGLEAAAREHVGDATVTQGDPRMADALGEVPVEVVAELGRITMGLRRVLGMRPGEVVRLGTAVDDPIVVRVADVKKLEGVPVISRGQLSVEIRGRHGE